MSPRAVKAGTLIHKKAGSRGNYTGQVPPDLAEITEGNTGQYSGRGYGVQGRREQGQ